ncbi:hypothetical protein FQR65_LT07765 [Abscondita terminalis]|nr:hypothetical protein FQR65_LT07765 [Abscondita terminalis]
MCDCLGTKKFVAENNIQSSEYDAILLIAHSGRTLKTANLFNTTIEENLKRDPGLKTEIGVLSFNKIPGGRIIYSPISYIDPDYDDVRIIQQAAAKGTKRALLTGSKKLLVVLEDFPEFEKSDLVGILAVLEVLYTPIQYRERKPSASKKLDLLGFYTNNNEKTKDIVRLATMLEGGRHITRDIAGGDPERMSSVKIQKYLEEVFSKTSIKLTVISDQIVLEKEYPLFSAVNRGASVVERHRGRIIYMEYNPPGEVKKTLLLVGKGVSFDTGGADVKSGGAMLSMSRDKCGAAALAGLMKIVDELKPQNTKVLAGLALVRNSIGSNCYVPDEILISRANVAVRVTNTDAEGRMAMADVLCKMKEIAVDSINPHLFTVATLTGHANLTSGNGIGIAMDNGPARKAGNSMKLQKCSEEIGDPFEISVLRREDFQFHKGKVEGEDIHQGVNGPSTRCQRGHQGPAAFIIMASGLDRYGSESVKPLKFTHLDICGDGAAGYPHPPTAGSLLTLVTTYLMHQ